MSRKQTARLLGLLAATGLLGCSVSPSEQPREQRDAQEESPAAFVGRNTCAECHSSQARSWRGSHHDLAMQVADETTVLGDFNEATFTHRGVASVFTRKDDEFWVRTDGLDGEIADFRIAFTFGVDPLQQYLIEFPDGRLQALSLAWDTRAVAEGGGRWFHLYPDEEIDHRHRLHWTRPSQNWNFMCAECHSTNLQKNYRFTEDRYETTFSEIDVSCEACHGPGSKHVEWASGNSAKEDPGPGLGFEIGFQEEERVAWVFDHETGTARRETPRTSHVEIETCGRCHSRRASLSSTYRHGDPLSDDYRVALLDEGLYHADGRIDDEVFVYGSFLQSKMYREGVTCKDCHDPHSARLVADANDVCARCHLPTKFDAPEHHHHPANSAGCVDCHMPETTYMVVDPRRDHSFRVPRPDLAEKVGAPGVCNDCHDDRSSQWAAEAIKTWSAETIDREDSGRSRELHYGEALHAGRTWQEDARDLLLRTVAEPETPGIARASAIRLLGRYPGPETLDAIDRAARDVDPLVRRAAVQASEAVEPGRRRDLSLPLLTDPMRSVRLQAARILAGVDPQLLSSEAIADLDFALEEYRSVQWEQAERAESHLNLGWLHLREGDVEAARESYLTAIRLQPSYLFSYLNLADLYRREAREDETEAVLRQALTVTTDEAAVHHALGLHLVRRKRIDEALRSLETAHLLRSEEPGYAYTYGIALHSYGETERALGILERAYGNSPGHRELIYALATIHRDLGHLEKARKYGRKLFDQMSEKPVVQRPLNDLR